jgi:tetratricopeptide (TPR) repeat protein
MDEVQGDALNMASPYEDFQLIGNLPQSKEINDLYKHAQNLVDTGRAELCLEILPSNNLFLTHPKLIDAAGLAAEYLGRYELAKTYYYQAIELFPNYPPPYLYAVRINDVLWNYAESERVLDESLRRFPTDPFLLSAKGEYLLRHRQYEDGWKYMEYRAIRRNLMERNKDLPLWDGSPLNGRTLLLAGEQGAGDHIMFARYLQPLGAVGNVVCYLQIPHVLDRLLQSVSPFPIYSTSEQLATVEKVDCWTSIGSLPLVLNQPIPTRMTYIKPDPNRVNEYRQYFSDAYDGIRVGLCWQGNPKNTRDTQRSFPETTFKPLMNIPGYKFFSLQKGNVTSGLPNLANIAEDFYDTAAMIKHLDLVITVDTAVAHLAGAMGKPVWILIGLNNDWRWGMRGESAQSVWYKNDMLFWQKEPGDWSLVIEEVRKKLYDVTDMVDRNTQSSCGR